MSRFDITGLFWDDYIAPKAPAEKVLRVAPEPVWLSPDYLPHWDEAKDFQIPEMSDAEVAACAGKRLIWDTEFYENYALVGFRCLETGRVSSFELGGTWGAAWGTDVWRGGLDKLAWILRSCTLIGFNDTAFDIPMAHACLAGFGPGRLHNAVEHLIFGNEGMGTRPAQFYKDFNITHFPVDNIDLIELTPLGPGLKVCAGRMHAKRMADLPFKPGIALSPQQEQVLRWYWYNDLENTENLYRVHGEAIKLREILNKDYGVDVRSKSDPQIAETIIRTEIQQRTGQRYIKRATIIPWRSFTYKAPNYLKYASPTMQWVLDFVQQQQFIVDDKGSPMMPPGLKDLEVRIADGVYTMGIGGLHSQENRVTHHAGDTHEISDNDVTSYYPSLMIQQGMYPPNVGPEFLTVFEGIVSRRVAAKRAGDKGTAETLKIVANGTFGKTGEKHGRSVVYYPEMMIQVTVTGQLSLLLLIERLEIAGIPVISANTDGIIVKCPLHLRDRRDAIFKQWEADTGLGLEAKVYKAVYSRDVNSYIAILDKPDPKDKTAYRYAKAVGAYRKTIDAYPLKWNPTCEVCSEALIEFLATGRPIDETIRACTDVRKFLQMRAVQGGAVKDGQYLGKVVRWYYSTAVVGEIIYARNGHAVPQSQGAQPCMDLPPALPADIDFDYYVARATAMLDDFEPKAKKNGSRGIALAAG